MFWCLLQLLLLMHSFTIVHKHSEMDSIPLLKGQYAVQFKMYIILPRNMTNGTKKNNTLWKIKICQDTTEYIGKHGIKRQLNSKQEFSLVVYQKYYSLLNQWLQVIHMQGNGKKNSYRKKKNKKQQTTTFLLFPKSKAR